MIRICGILSDMVKVKSPLSFCFFLFGREGLEHRRYREGKVPEMFLGICQGVITKAGLTLSDSGDHGC